MKRLALLALCAGLIGCGGPAPQPTPTPPVPKSPLILPAQKVVFIGDSVVNWWGTDSSFQTNWTAYGQLANTCAQLSPQLDYALGLSSIDSVLILCGISDLMVDKSWTLADSTGPIDAMITNAKSRGLKVYVGTLPPFGPGPTAHGFDPDYVSHLQKIKQLNDWVRSRAGITAVDFYPRLAGSDGLFSPSLTDDGVHPNRSGYAIMSQILTTP